MKLPLLDHLCWLALRRVRRGGVAKLSDCYVDGGHPLGVLLADSLDELLKQGMLDVAEPGPEDGLARVSLTEAGQAHYRTLCQRQHAPLPAPPPEFATTPIRQPSNSEFACIELPAETLADHHRLDSSGTSPTVRQEAVGD